MRENRTLHCSHSRKENMVCLANGVAIVQVLLQVWSVALFVIRLYSIESGIDYGDNAVSRVVNEPFFFKLSRDPERS